MAEQVYLGRYRVTRQLDQGGMSRIFLARDGASGRDVVVKVLKPECLASSKPREHFRREIHIMSRFEHPNAVKYLDAAPNDPGGPVLVMEYLRGVDLGVLLHQQRRLSPERAGRLLGQLCDVLQAAHDGGIIHRDIKPGNLMIVHGGTPDETLKLMDFGLAKITAMLYIAPDELVNYAAPAASGTPEYISPEEVRGQEVDARADLYSVGVVLYEMLAGRLPFRGDDVQKLMKCHEKVTPPTFAEIGLGGLIPSAIEDVVRCCLNKQPDQRPRSAAELALRYEKALGKRITQFRRAGAAELRDPLAQRLLVAQRQLRRGARPLVGLLVQAAAHHVLDGRRDQAAQAELRERRRRHLLVALHQLLHVVAAERQPARQHLVQHHADAVQVGAGVDLLAAHLLGADVLGRPRGGRRRVVDQLVRRDVQHRRDLRQAEVHQLERLVGRAAVDDHQVARLDVAVDDAAVVRGLEHVAQLAQKPAGPLRREAA